MFSLAIWDKAAWGEVQIHQEKFFGVMVLKQWNRFPGGIGWCPMLVIVQEDDLNNALHNMLLTYG